MEHAVRLDGLCGHVPPIRHTPIVRCGTKILERLTAGYESQLRLSLINQRRSGPNG